MASNVFEIYAKLGLDTSAYDKALDDAMGRAQNATGQISGIGTGAASSSTALNKFGSVLKTGVSGALKVATAAIGAATTAVVGLGTYATKTGMEFEAQMSKVEAISGANAEEMEALTEKAEEMGAITKFSATEAGQAYEYMAMAGWKTGDMLGGIEGIMNLAAASGESLATTSDIVTDALTAFGLAAEDSAHFADVLARASSSSNTNVGMMGETFKYVAPLAGAMGYSVADVAVAIGLMANAGIKAGQAGTSLRSALSSLTKPTEAAKDVMRELGLIVTETRRVIDQSEVYKQQDKLATATANLEKKQIAYNAALKKYGEDSDKTATALINLEEAQRKVATAQRNLSIAAEGTVETFDLYNQTLTDEKGNMLSFSETIEGLRMAFSGLSESEQASAAATLFGQEAMSGMLAIINASDEDFATLTAAIAGADGTAQEMAATMQDNLAGALEELGGSAETFGLAIYNGIAESLKEVVVFATDSLNQLTEAYRKGGVEGLTDAAGKILSSMVTKLTNGLPQILKVGVNLLTSLLDGLLSKTNIKKLTDSASTIVKTLADGALSLLEKIFDVGWELLLSLVEGIIDALPELLKTAVDLVLHIVTEITKPDSLHRLLMAAVELVKALVKGLVESIPSLISAAFEIISGLIEFLKDPQNLADLLAVGIELLAEIAKGVITGGIALVNAVANLASEAFNKFRNTDWKSLGSDLIDSILRGLKNSWYTITNWFDDKISDLRDTVSNLWDSITGAKKEANNVQKNQLTTRSSSSYAETYNPTFNVQLNLDGRTAAETLLNPLEDLRKQRGY